MQVLQHEIDSLRKINDVGSFFDKCLIPQDILDKANAMAAAEGFSRHNASHLLKAGLPMDQLPNAGFRPTELKNFQPVQYYNYWKINSASVGFLYRFEFVKRNGFPIITKENIDTLVKLMQGRKVLDVGSGACVFGEELKKHGIDLKTLDTVNYKGKEPNPEGGYSFITDYSPDILGSIESQDISDYNTFLISWCDLEGGASTSVLRRMKRGDILITNGEGQGGCTDSNRFFDILYAMENKKKIVSLDEVADQLNDNSYRFYGIHDRFSVYERR